MKRNDIVLRDMVAARASSCGKRFAKSYVKNIRLEERRRIPGHLAGYCEEDYSFEYKGRRYRVNKYIVPNSSGEVIYSAKFRFELVEV